MMTNWLPSAAKAIPARPNTIAAVRAYFIGGLLLVGAQEIATNLLKHAEFNSGNLRTSCGRFAAAQPSGHGHLLFHLVGDDLERGERMRAERGRDGHVGGVAPTRDENAANTRNIVARIERVPAAVEEHLEPGAEIHRGRVGRNADIAEITGAIARRDVHAAAKRDSEMREVAAHAPLLDIGIVGGAADMGVLVAELDVLVDEVADCLHQAPAFPHLAEFRP